VSGPSELIELLKTTGPLVTSSANLPGEPPAIDTASAETYFGEHVDCYIDGGVIAENNPSTLIRITDNDVQILRQGAVTIEPNKENP
jgi:L-threonylcarbamoyladenylate synthase